MEKSPKDPFLNMKYVAYCWSQLPPGEQNLELQDYVEHCKFVLCEKSNRLMKDPIWSENARKEFEAELNKLFGVSIEDAVDAFADWVDSMEGKEEKELESEYEDQVSFSPGELGE